MWNIAESHNSYSPSTLLPTRNHTYTRWSPTSYRNPSPTVNEADIYRWMCDQLMFSNSLYTTIAQSHFLWFLIKGIVKTMFNGNNEQIDLKNCNLGHVQNIYIGPLCSVVESVRTELSKMMVYTQYISKLWFACLITSFLRGLFFFVINCTSINENAHCPYGEKPLLLQCYLSLIE